MKFVRKYGIRQRRIVLIIFAAQYNPSSPVASHFTQVVWKGTTQVGCAVQSCSGIFAASFGVCLHFRAIY